MNKDLIMHFRIHHKLENVPTKIPGTGKVVTQKILKPYLGKRGPGAYTFGGVTVCAIRYDHPLLGMTLRWGAALCLSQDKYVRKDGYEMASQVAYENDFITKDVSYANGKEIATVIAEHIWKSQNIMATMTHLFAFTSEVLPVEATSEKPAKMKKAA